MRFICGMGQIFKKLESFIWFLQTYPEFGIQMVDFILQQSLESLAHCRYLGIHAFELIKEQNNTISSNLKADHILTIPCHST